MIDKSPRTTKNLNDENPSYHEIESVLGVRKATETREMLFRVYFKDGVILWLPIQNFNQEAVDKYILLLYLLP